MIISHNPISTYGGMEKTLMTLFSSFSREELCQLYIYPSVPDLDRCVSYYRITDKQIIKSLGFFKVHGGTVKPDAASHTVFEDPGDERIYRRVTKIRSLLILLRDLAWKYSKWFNNDLKNWIREQKPTCIFAAPGSQTFLYYMALKISGTFNIPIVTYICDEFYFRNSGRKIIDRIQLKRVQKAMQRLLAKTKHVVTICDEAERLYSSTFHVPATTIMTGASFQTKPAPEIKQVKSLTYMGGIRGNRNIFLADIGRTIDSINKSTGSGYSLDIYSPEKDGSILSAFSGIDSIKFHGFVSGDDYKNIFFDSDIFIHVESFYRSDTDRTKHSISTKIADTLSSGIPLFAYGPREIASINYLIKNDCAIVAASPDVLAEQISHALSDTGLIRQKVENALKTSAINHNKKLNSEKLRTICLK